MKLPETQKILLYKAEKNRNKIRDKILVSTIVASICITTLIISLLYGKYMLDRGYYEHISGKTASISIENASLENKKIISNLPYIHSIWEEHENGKILLNGLHFATCISTDHNTFTQLYQPTFTSISGDFPSKENEIILSKKALKRLGIDTPVLGSKIELDFHWAQLKYTKLTGRQTFILSGFYEADEESGEIFTAFLSSSRLQKADIPQFPCKLLMRINIPWWSKEYTQNQLEKDISLAENQRITYENSASYKAIERTGGNIYLLFFTLFFVAVCAYLVIYNVLSISSIKDLKDYELLRIIGATYKQIRSVILKRMRRIWIKGCLIAGCICIPTQYILIPTLLRILYERNSQKDIPISIIPFGIFLFMSLLSGCVLLFSTLSIHRKLVHKNLAKQRRYHTHSILANKKKIFKAQKESKTLFLLALNRLFRSKRNVCLSIILLFLGCEISLLGTIILSGMDQLKSLKQNPDFTIEMPMNTMMYLLESSTNENELERLDGLSLLEFGQTLEDNVENLKFNLKPVRCVLVKNDNGIKNIQVLESENPPFFIYEDTSYISALIEYAKKHHISINEKEFMKGKGVFILHANSFATAKADEMYRQNKEESSMQVSSIVPVGTDMTHIPSYTLDNCGFMDITAPGFPQLHTPWKSEKNIYLLARKEFFDSLNDSLKTQYVKAEIYVKAKDIDRIECRIDKWIKTQNQLLQSETGNPGIDQFIYMSNRDLLNREKSYILAGKVTTYTVSVLLIFIGLGLYLITAITNTFVYHSELNLLHVLGITRKNIVKILFYESFIYAASVYALWMSIGNLLLIPTVMICKNYESFSYRYPFPLIIGMSFGLLIICITVPILWKQRNGNQKKIKRS